MSGEILREIPDRIKDWASLTKVQDIFRRAEDKEEWVFRGLSDGSIHLKTTLERVAEEFKVPGVKIPDLEVKLIHEFMRRYHLYAAEPPPSKGDTLDWLALMRHHGAPSRLLDFTFSFLVAAYFSLERKPNGDPAIWAVNKSWLAKNVPEILKKRSKTIASQFKRYAKYRDGDEFRNVFFKGRPRLVSPVNPFRLNQRLTIQQGLFLCPGDVTVSFMDNLKAMPNYDDNVKVIPIAYGARSVLLAALHRANLNRATLFPGLDGFASSLWTRVTSLKRLQSMEDSGARSKVNLDIEALRRW